jgi:hypothetical protein
VGRRGVGRRAPRPARGVRGLCRHGPAPPRPARPSRRRRAHHPGAALPPPPRARSAASRRSSAASRRSAISLWCGARVRPFASGQRPFLTGGRSGPSHRLCFASIASSCTSFAPGAPLAASRAASMARGARSTRASPRRRAGSAHGARHGPSGAQFMLIPFRSGRGPARHRVFARGTARRAPAARAPPATSCAPLQRAALRAGGPRARWGVAHTGPIGGGRAARARPRGLGSGSPSPRGGGRRGPAARSPPQGRARRPRPALPPCAIAPPRPALPRATRAGGARQSRRGGAYGRRRTPGYQPASAAPRPPPAQRGRPPAGRGGHIQLRPPIPPASPAHAGPLHEVGGGALPAICGPPHARPPGDRPPQERRRDVQPQWKRRRAAARAPGCSRRAGAANCPAT